MSRQLFPHQCHDMNNTIERLINKIRPDLKNASGQQRMSGIADVFTLFYTLPLALIGIIWLLNVSEWGSFRQQWSVYIIMALILYIFNRLRFFFITEIRAGGYANSDGALDGIAVWVSILLLGPTALWLKVVWDSAIFTHSIIHDHTIHSYWNRSRMFVADLATDVLATLFALMVYHWAGGTIPIQGYSIEFIVPAFLAIVAQYLGTIVIYSGYIAYVIRSLAQNLHTPTRPAVSFFMMALSLPALANPFGILAAGIYAQQGIWEFINIILGLIIVAYLARKLSQAAEYSRQQSRQIEQLEKLGRAIIDSAPDGSQLPMILQRDVPSMFSSHSIIIWTESSGFLLQEPANLTIEYQQAWNWLQQKKEALIMMPRERIPWNPSINNSGPMILCPIISVDAGDLIGEIIIEMQSLTIPWDKRAVQRQLPAVQSLAAQVASAINQTNNYAKTLAMQKTLQELTLARSIQASFLPERIPILPGWQLAASLEPARQVAGDFYDFIHLSDGKLGVLIADVADKGLGSALYMALSGTLIRTFASDHVQAPALVLKTVNQHILRNARANLFVTVFFGVLDPVNGILSYANAGHNPPFLVGVQNGIKTLENTGMPLGIDEQNDWSQREITISPGEMLMMYTDGVTDAQNDVGEFIDRKIILNTLQQNIGKPAQEVQKHILDRIHHFVGDAPRFDDLTLVLVMRENGVK
jgi:serine phosphatase RsbU (regulator of sigma subunit)